MENSLKKILPLTVIFIYLLVPINIVASIENENSENFAKKIYYLDNSELLKQSETQLKNSLDSFLIQLRAIARDEIFFKEAQEKFKNLPIKPKSMKKVDFNTEQEAIKVKFNYAKERLDSLNERAKLLNNQKNILNDYIKNIELANSNADLLANSLKNLNLVLIEIRLRIEDKTLNPNSVPKTLLKKSIKNEEKKLLIAKEELNLKFTKSLKDLEEVNREIDINQKSIIEAQTIFILAKEQNAQELKREAIEREYLNRAEDELLKTFSELKEERFWLKTALDRSKVKFDKYKKDILNIEDDISVISRPKNLQLLENSTENSADIENSIEQIVENSKYKIEKLKELKSSVLKMSEFAKSLKDDSLILNENLFMMQIVAKLLKDRTSKESYLNEAVDKNGEISKFTKEILTEIKNSQKRLKEIDIEVEKAKKTEKEANIYLENLEEAEKNELKLQKWELELTKLTSQEVLITFFEIENSLKENLKKLSKNREEFKTKNQILQEIKERIKTLKDPFYKIALEKSGLERENITKLLYGLAEFELHMKSKLKSIQSHKIDNKPITTDIDYQNILSTKLTLIQEYNKEIKNLKNISNELKDIVGDYLKNLTEVIKLEQQYHRSAIELKKRVAKNELDKEKIPNNILKTQNLDRVENLKKEIADKLKYETKLQKTIDKLNRTNKLPKNRENLFISLKDIIGKRLDTLTSIKKLESEFGNRINSKTKKQTKMQSALRDMKSEDTLIESLLSFIKSEDLTNLNRLLQTYYLELANIKKQENNLKIQNREIEYLLKSIKNEKTELPQILTLLKREKTLLELEKEQKLTKIKALIISKKSENISNDYQQIKTLIDTEIDSILNSHIEIASTDRWIRLFEIRESEKGLNSKVTLYQNSLANLNIEKAKLKRKKDELRGITLEELEKLPESEKPQNELEKIALLKGEIGLLRDDRYELAKSSLNIILIKLIIVLILATILSILITKTVKRVIRESINRTDLENIQHKQLMTLIRRVSKVFIWSIATIMILDITGFNIGAFLAGLGIGGFAIAIAAKGILADLFGGLTIMLVKPFKVGDIILIQEQKCIVKKIGLRYTTLENDPYKYEHTVPNSIVTEAEIINIDTQYGLTIVTNFNLSIENSSEKLPLAIDIIENIINENEEAKLSWVKHDHFDNYSFVLATKYNVPNYKDRHRVETDINIEIVKQFKEKNIEFTSMPK